MTKKELMVKAHKMAKEIKVEYPEVDYKFQLGLCMSYLLNEGVNEMVELKGSEKQIVLGKKVRKEMLEDLETMKEKPILNGQYIAKYLGVEFPKAIRKDASNKALRTSIGNKYLEKVEKVLKSEEMASKFIARNKLSFELIVEIIENGKMA